MITNQFDKQIATLENQIAANEINIKNSKLERKRFELMKKNFETDMKNMEAQAEQLENKMLGEDIRIRQFEQDIEFNKLAIEETKKQLEIAKAQAQPKPAETE